MTTFARACARIPPRTKYYTVKCHASVLPKRNSKYTTNTRTEVVCGVSVESVRDGVRAET